jgi:hypothetical protein
MPESAGRGIVLHKSSTVCLGALSMKLFAATLLLLVIAGPLRAGEIITYRDETGRCVYVNKEDHELRVAVQRGGVQTGLRLIDQRKRTLANIDDYIEEISRQQQIDPRLVHAVIEVESAWNTRARSRKGALGLMQLMPETAARFQVRDPFDPKENIRAGVSYLRILLGRFDQNLTHALAAYNAGESVVAAHKGVPPFAETQSYIARISALYGNLYGKLQTRSAPPQDGKTVVRAVENGQTIYSNMY